MQDRRRKTSKDAGVRDERRVRRRINICLSDDVHGQGKLDAKLRGLSFSSYIASLIMRDVVVA